MYDSIKLKLVCVSSGAPRPFDAVQNGVTDPSHSAESIGLNKKQIVAILNQLCYGLNQKCNWFECDDAVVLKDYHLNQQGLVLSISWGAPATGKRQMKCFTTCPVAIPGASMSLFQGQFYINGNLCSLYTAKQGKPSVPKFMCTNTECMRPRVSKELFLSESEKLPLWYFTVA